MKTINRALEPDRLRRVIARRICCKCPYAAVCRQQDVDVPDASACDLQAAVAPLARLARLRDPMLVRLDRSLNEAIDGVAVSRAQTPLHLFRDDLVELICQAAGER